MESKHKLSQPVSEPKEETFQAARTGLKLTYLTLLVSRASRVPTTWSNLLGKGVQVCQTLPNSILTHALYFVLAKFRWEPVSVRPQLDNATTRQQHLQQKALV